MRKSFVIFALFAAVVFIGCDAKNQMPSRYVLDKVAADNNNAEAISIDSICVFNQLVKETVIPLRFGFDMRNDSEISISNSEELKESLSVYEIYVASDSIVNVIKFDPIDSLINELGSVVLHYRQYTFHKNGDIEIKIGNDLKEGYDLTNQGVVKYAYIDGVTGLVVNSFTKDDSNETNYRITNIGEIEIGQNYGDYEKSGVYMFEILTADIHRAMETYSKFVR